MSAPPKLNRARHLYSPERAVDTTIAHVEEQIAHPLLGIKALVPGIQNKLDPLKQGDLLGILAFTSNFKTSYVNYIISQYAHELQSRWESTPGYNHIAVQFSWEQPIEQMIGVDISRVTGISVQDILYGRIDKHQLEKMKDAGVARKKKPVWLVGPSIHDKRDRPLLSMVDVIDILSFVDEEVKMSIDLVVLDYLQRIKYRGSDRVEGTIGVCDDARTLAIHQPTILLAQAKRECFERPWGVPMLDDCQWSSNFEQSCTHMHGLWRPAQKKLETIKFGGSRYKVAENMLVHEIMKQTLGPVGVTTLFEIGYGGTYLQAWPGLPLLSKD